MFVSVHVASVPCVGLVDVAALPASSTATHIDTEGHDTSWNPPGPPTWSGALHVVGSAGSVVVKTLPRSSTVTHSAVDGQEIRTRQEAPRQFSGGSMFVVDQLAASAGSSEVRTLPALSTATQSEIEGQATPSSEIVPSLTGSISQLEPSVGSVEVSTLPLSSTATQSVDGDSTHETSWMMLPGSVPDSIVHVAEAPPPGFVEVTKLPAPSPATHRDADGHPSAQKRFVVPSMPALVAQFAPPSVVVSALPALSTVAHSDTEGQAMSTSVLAPSTPMSRVQVGVAASGLLEYTTRPIRSTPTHSVVGVVVHDMPSSCVMGRNGFGGGSTSLIVHAPAPPVGFVEVR